MTYVFGGGGGTVTAAEIESTFTAAGQIYVGSGSGTGTVGTGTSPQVGSIGVGVAPSGTAGEITMLAGTGFIGLHANGQWSLGNSNNLITFTNSGTTTLSTTNGLNLATGIKISSTAAVSNPTPSSGVAFTPNANYTTQTVITSNCSVAGSVAVTMGPSTGAEDTVTSAVSLLAGQGETVTFIVPDGYKVIVTTTGTVTLSSSVTVI